MRRWIIVLVAVLALVIIAFIPVIQSTKLIINAPYLNVYQSLTVGKNWQKWYPGFSSSNSRVNQNVNSFKITGTATQVVFHKSGINSFNFELKQGNKTGNYNGALAYGATMKKVELIVERKVKLFEYLQALLSASNEKNTPLYNLKLYMEDSQRYYGFVINKRLTTNKLLIVERAKVLSSNVCSNNRMMLSKLADFALANKLYKTAPVQLQYLSTAQDSTEAMIGIPVSKKVAKPIPYMETPGGKVVVGYFKGKYKNRQQLYIAMRQYVADNYLHSLTMPFEVFKYDQLPENDESVVDMQVIIPFI